MAKKKQWYEIISPNVFGNKVVGETITDEPKRLINRVIPVTGKELTGDIKKSYVTVKLKVNSITGDKANTVVNNYSVQRQYLQHFIRKGYSVIDIIADGKTEDNKNLRFKSLITIVGRVQTQKKKLIRKTFVSEIIKVINSSKLDNLIFLVIAGKVQHTLLKKVSKVFPIKLVEVKKIEIRSDKKTKA